MRQAAYALLHLFCILLYSRKVLYLKRRLMSINDYRLCTIFPSMTVRADWNVCVVIAAVTHCELVFWHEGTDVAPIAVDVFATNSTHISGVLRIQRKAAQSVRLRVDSHDGSAFRSEACRCGMGNQPLRFVTSLRPY